MQFLSEFRLKYFFYLSVPFSYSPYIFCSSTRDIFVILKSIAFILICTITFSAAYNLYFIAFRSCFASTFSCWQMKDNRVKLFISAITGSAMSMCVFVKVLHNSLSVLSELFARSMTFRLSVMPNQIMGAMCNVKRNIFLPSTRTQIEKDQEWNTFKRFVWSFALHTFFFHCKIFERICIHCSRYNRRNLLMKVINTFLVQVQITLYCSGLFFIIHFQFHFNVMDIFIVQLKSGSFLLTFYALKHRGFKMANETFQEKIFFFTPIGT